MRGMPGRPLLMRMMIMTIFMCRTIRFASACENAPSTRRKKRNAITTPSPSSIPPPRSTAPNIAWTGSPSIWITTPFDSIAPSTNERAPRRCIGIRRGRWWSGSAGGGGRGPPCSRTGRPGAARRLPWGVFSGWCLVSAVSQ